MNRRGFLGGLISALAAPAIVHIDFIMPVKQAILVPSRNLLTIEMITKEAIELFRSSNTFTQSLAPQYDYLFDYEDDYNYEDEDEDDYKVAA